MKTQKPKTGTISPSRKPVIIDNTKDKLNWSFSFKYFKQIKHFGLGETSTKWFVSLLEKLSDLSKVYQTHSGLNGILRVANESNTDSFNIRGNIPS